MRNANTEARRVLAAVARPICPPCHGNCNQGRTCPASIEDELYPPMTRDERLGRLSADEEAMLGEMNARGLIPFRVTVTVAGRATERINVLAGHSCDAITRTLDLLFSDWDAEKPAGLSIKAEAMNRRQIREAA